MNAVRDWDGRGPVRDEAWFASRASRGVQGLKAYDPGHDLVAFLLAIEWGTRQDGILEPGPGPAPAPSGLQLAAGPNPAPGDVRFLYALPAAGPARLAIYDVTGQLVATLL